jgi:hypothetical protein
VLAGTELQFRYKPQGKTLEQYILSRQQRTCIMGPLGSGKTNASCWKAFRVMCGQAPENVAGKKVRRTRILAVRNTFSDLFATTIKDWLEMFDGLGRFNKGGREPPTHYCKFELDDGTEVDAEMIFLALDRPEHVKKLRGYQLTAAWLNEMKELSFSIVEMMDLRIGRFPADPTWFGMWGDTNAPDTDHWYYRVSEELRPEGWLFLKQPGGVFRKRPDAPWEPNPKAENVENLPLAYYENGVQGKRDQWITVNLANEYGFITDGKPVYPDFRDSAHCKDFELIPGRPLHIGLDFGLTPAALIAQRTVLGQWRVRYEVCTQDTGVIRFADILKRTLIEKCKGFKIASITGDPAGDQRQPGDSEERTVFQILSAHGVVAEPAPFNNDFAMRVESVSSVLRRFIDGEPGFLLHPDCRVTRKGMAGDYKFRRMQIANEDRYTDEPVKNSSSHPCEALQYLLLGNGEGNLVIQPNTEQRRADAAGYREKRGLAVRVQTRGESARRKRGL